MTSVIQSDGTIIFIPFPQESAEEEYAVQRMMEDGAGASRPGGMVEEGVLILLKESATVHMAKVYGLAAYELSDLRMSTDEKVDLAA